MSFIDHASGIRLPMSANWLKSGRTLMTLQFSDMTSPSKIFDVAVFLLPGLVTDQNFISIT